MKRKLMAAVFSLAAVASLCAGCSSGQKEAAATTAAAAVTEAKTETEAKEQTEAAAASAGESYSVYLITMDQMDQHWVNVDAGAQKAVKELGNVEYKWLAPDVKDDAKQIECINNAVAGGAQAILLAANGPDAVTASLQEAIDAGVKVVYVDSAASLPAVQTLATDNKAAGKTAGEEMIKALKAGGIESGKIGIVNVNAATASTVAREEGFRSAFEGTGFEILETQYGEGDAAKSKDIAANYITQGCVGIFGANEGSTVGTGNAIQEAGETVIGVGFDKSDMIMQLIKEGHLLATMAQNPDVMGYEGIKTAVNALEGKDTGAENVDTGVSVLTKDTIK
ncbi:ABC transporter substrate-binding protein [Lachnospiraceae bacterium 54-53]